MSTFKRSIELMRWGGTLEDIVAFASAVDDVVQQGRTETEGVLGKTERTSVKVLYKGYEDDYDSVESFQLACGSLDVARIQEVNVSVMMWSEPKRRVFAYFSGGPPAVRVDLQAGDRVWADGTTALLREELLQNAKWPQTGRSGLVSLAALAALAIAVPLAVGKGEIVFPLLSLLGVLFGAWAWGLLEWAFPAFQLRPTGGALRSEVLARRARAGLGTLVVLVLGALVTIVVEHFVHWK